MPNFFRRLSSRSDSRALETPVWYIVGSSIPGGITSTVIVNHHYSTSAIWNKKTNACLVSEAFVDRMGATKTRLENPSRIKMPPHIPEWLVPPVLKYHSQSVF